MTDVVKMRQIEKAFGANAVLKRVDFTLETGSIHALLGENGTGKTTLMNILTGVYTKDQGDIEIDGAPATPASQQQIAFIHQELSLVNDLAVYENLYLGHELKRYGILRRREMISTAQAFVDQIGIELDVTAMVRDLNASYKQITEIVRALMRDAKVIIMDEPTTSLTDVEINDVFKMMRSLRDQGVSLIFISHKLNEVLEICDTYTIMRDGVVVSSGQVTPALTEVQLSNQMVGKELANSEIYQPRPLGKPVLTLKGLTKAREFQNVDLVVHRGEIIGVTGLLGDGRSELFSAVVGATVFDAGQVLVNERPARIKTTADIKRYGIAYLPKNRKENGIVPDLNIEENLALPILGRLSRGGLINRGQLTATVQRYVKQINIKVADVKDVIGSLSGGNQQKVLLAKALCTEPNVVILDNPTQGVDVGAKAEIYHQIMDLAKTGISFVILTSEIAELQQLCDRVYVMTHGEVRAELAHGAINERDIMLVATGGQLD